MASLRITTSADRLHDVYGVFLHLQMENDPSASEIQAFWQGQQDELQQANAKWKEALHEQLRVRSQRVWERPKLRNAIRTFANTLLEMGSGSRKTLLYQSYFPNGYAKVSSGNLDDQIAAAKSILYRLESDTNETLRTEGDALRAAVESAEAIETAWRDVQVTVAERKDALDKAKRVWLAAYRRVEGELTALHSENPSLVSAFFLQRQRKKRGSVSQEEGNGVGSEETVEKMETLETPSSGYGSGNGSGNGVPSPAHGSSGSENGSGDSSTVLVGTEDGLPLGTGR